MPACAGADPPTRETFAIRPPDLLQRLSEICLALPEATREDMGDHAAFAVRKKKYAYFLNDHHGDGIVSVCFKAAPGEGPLLIDSDPDLFYSPAYIGPRGWVFAWTWMRSTGRKWHSMSGQAIA